MIADRIVDFEYALQILSYAHRYNMEDLQYFVAELLSSDSHMSYMNDSEYTREMINEAHYPQNIALKSKIFPALADCDYLLSFFITFTPSLDILEEGVKLPPVKCEDEIEVLVHVLNFFGSVHCDAEEDQVKRPASYLTFERRK